MEKNNTVDRKGRLVRNAFGLVLGGLLLTGCKLDNYSGHGNEFDVRGVVTHGGKQSITARVYEIDQTHGEANGWFKIGKKHQLHDNCDCHGFWRDRKQYGQVLDATGAAIEPANVLPGTCVEFVGRVRSNAEGKTSEYRPVYDTAQIIPCEPK